MTRRQLKFIFSLDLILCGWLGSKYHLSLSLPLSLSISLCLSLCHCLSLSGKQEENPTAIAFNTEEKWWNTKKRNSRGRRKRFRMTQTHFSLSLSCGVISRRISDQTGSGENLRTLICCALAKGSLEVVFLDIIAGEDVDCDTTERIQTGSAWKGQTAVNRSEVSF